jgi:CRISPR-associated exonuclease Cas4
MVYNENDFLPVSALQHLVFCPRQCALIHIEREWDENVLTARGRLEHERVDEGYKEFRRGRRQVSGLVIKSETLGLQGRIDVLEMDLVDEKGSDNLPSFGVRGTWSMQPVEFKHGKPKESDCDRIQVCAQAICLEEMTGMRIVEASLFYRRIRRREEVVLDEDLRQKTVMFSKALHELFNSGLTPPPVYNKRCKSCSFLEKCIPNKMGKKNRYRDVLFKPQEAE